ncbi:hypothetical protein G5V59_05965 [Nocardioides sp. W3-2-3]|nr:hypothetical protein [Nocardioides convexus]
MSLLMASVAALACLWFLLTLFGWRRRTLAVLALYLTTAMTVPAFVWWAAALNQAPAAGGLLRGGRGVGALPARRGPAMAGGGRAGARVRAVLLRQDVAGPPDAGVRGGGLFRDRRTGAPGRHDRPPALAGRRGRDSGRGRLPRGLPRPRPADLRHRRARAGGPAGPGDGGVLLRLRASGRPVALGPA